MHEAALKYVVKKVEAKAKGKSLGRSVVKEIICKIQVKIKLPANTIKSKTICSRFRRKSLIPIHSRLVSPLIPIKGIA